MANFGLYLQEMTLKNFATFEDQRVSFSNQFNSIIGETGSGKSLILDAIQLILGHRADKKLIRFASDFSTIEATFHCSNPQIKEFFFDNGFPFDSDEVVIKRILYKSGKTKSYLNHQSCSLSMLSLFSSQFIDLVGQFENQKLLSEPYQLQLLDSYAKLNEPILEYSKVYNQILETEKKIKTLTESNQQAASRLDYINFQITELEKLNPTPEDEKELIQQKKKYQDFEVYKKNLFEINVLFNGEDHIKGLFTTLNRIETLLSDNIANPEQFSSFILAKDTLSDLNYSLNLTATQELDEEAFEEIIDKLDIYQKLKRKFNTTTEGLVTIYQDFITEKDQIKNLNQNLDELEKQLTEHKNLAFKLATQIHEKRVSGAKKLSKALTLSIHELKMEGATIKISLEKTPQLNKMGMSSINFNAETNQGEGFFKVKDIASGGELSRILLAVRKVLSSNDSISIFLFDEIDSGIGGETALSIGKSLQDVAKSSQVIAITHLPQIANFSQKLILVNKNTIDKKNVTRTVSQIQEVMGAQLKEHVISMNPLN